MKKIKKLKNDQKIKQEVLFEHADQSYKALKKNAKAWQKELEERELWDVTLLDGLEE